MPPGSTSLPVASTISVAGAEVGAERRDAAVADADIAGEGVGGGRDRAAADDRVECHQFLTCVVLPMREIPAAATR